MIWSHLLKSLDFPCAQMVKNPPAKEETQGIRVPSLYWEDPLEEDTATHFRILAWRSPWREEPRGLQSIRSQTVRPN